MSFEFVYIVYAEEEEKKSMLKLAWQLCIWTNTCWHQIAVGGSQSTFKSCQSFAFFFLPFWHSSIRISLCDDLLAVLSVIINISKIISSPQFTKKLNILFFVWNQSGEENCKVHASKFCCLCLASKNREIFNKVSPHEILSKLCEKVSKYENITGRAIIRKLLV